MRPNPWSKTNSGTTRLSAHDSTAAMGCCPLASSLRRSPSRARLGGASALRLLEALVAGLQLGEGRLGRPGRRRFGGRPVAQPGPDGRPRRRGTAAPASPTMRTRAEVVRSWLMSRRSVKDGKIPRHDMRARAAMSPQNAGERRGVSPPVPGSTGGLTPRRSPAGKECASAAEIDGHVLAGAEDDLRFVRHFAAVLDLHRHDLVGVALAFLQGRASGTSGPCPWPWSWCRRSTAWPRRWAGRRESCSRGPSRSASS